MNRKWIIISLTLLLSSIFVSGVYSAPLVVASCKTTFNQVCAFVVNFPSNQNVTVTNFPKSTSTSPAVVYAARNANFTVQPNAVLSIANVSTAGYREADMHVHFVSAIAPNSNGNPNINPITLYALPTPDSSFPGVGDRVGVGPGWGDSTDINNLHQGGDAFFVYNVPPGQGLDFGTQARILVTGGQLRIWLVGVGSSQGVMTVTGLTIALYMIP